MGWIQTTVGQLWNGAIFKVVQEYEELLPHQVYTVEHGQIYDVEGEGQFVLLVLESFGTSYVGRIVKVVPADLAALVDDGN